MPKRHRKKSTASKPAKRRPPSSPEPAEQYFTIRDILAEKYERDKLLYLVDWEDDPTTGEKYEPTWEPDKNVTAAAIADWEIKKLHSQGAQIVSSSPPPAQPAHSGPKRQRSHLSSAEDGDGDDRPSKRARITVDSGYTSSPVDDFLNPPSKNGGIVVDIPAVPGIDPSEYAFVTPSQSSAVAQGVASQRTIPDSQEDTVTQSTPAATTEPVQSQLTDPVEEEVVEYLGTEAFQEEQAPGSEAFHTDIPSHQPDSATHHHGLPSFLLEHQSSSGSFSRDPSLELTNTLVDGDDSSKVSGSRGFLTQPDYDIPLPSQEVDDSTRDPPHPSPSGSFNFQSASSSPILSQQAAQLVQPLQVLPTHDSGHFRTQSQEALEHSQSIIGPNTVSTRESETASRDSNSLVSGSRVLTFATGSDRNSFHSSESGSGQLLSGGNSTSRHRTMDPPRDAIQELRDALLKSAQKSPAPSALLAATNDSLSVQSPVLRDAVQELKSAIPKFDFSQPSAERSFQPDRETPEHQSAVGQLKEGTALARQRQGMDLDPSPSPFRFHTHPTPGLSTELPVIGTHSQTFDHLPTTVAPSDLTTSVDLPHVVDHEPNDMFAENPQFYEAAGPVQISGNAHDDHEDADYDRAQFVVTLPMAANARAAYLATIREYHDVMMQFGKVFSDSLYAVPEAALIAKLEALFERLQVLCDLPVYDEEIHGLVPEEMMKHATNSNCKYSFVYEFLTGLSDINPRILIVSQPGRVFNYLEAVIQTTNHSYKVLGRPEASAEEASVILADASQDLLSIHGTGIEVVILFDEAARSAKLPANLGYGPTTVLSLAAAYSLEHIELQLEREHPNMKGLEKKNALNLVTAALRRYLESPERGIHEPHEAAALFANYTRNPDAGIDYDTHELPDDVFDVWRNNSQVQTSQGEASDILNSRKRHMDEDNHVVTKRPKTMLNSMTGPISDLLRDCLARHEVDEESSANRVEVSVALLERLAAKEHNLENQLAAQTSSCTKYRELAKNQELQRLSWEHTVNSLQPAYHEALNDRKKFEVDCKAATARADAAAQQLEASRTQTEALKEKVRVLESDLANANAALRSSSIPEVAEFAQLEHELKQEQHRAQAIRDRAASVERQADYLRQRHQDTTSAQNVQERVNKDLEAQVALLRQRDVDAAIEVNRMHVQMEHELTTKQLDEYKAIIQDREQELSRLRQELQAYKSNRRETRSPRPGSIMSPRPSRGATAAGSRGTSPALPTNSDPAAPGGMNYIGGNSSRLSHLRSE
ncbi:citron Rho-interacting kinase [Cladorrhinum sp. PSN332]|nr:citron Rho-interacting kinase [Cladorrhinum sp. PSN332]